MKQRKLIFLDIDGTIYEELGVIPESARKAIHLAKENGHLVFVCSGRGRYEIAKEILDLGMDGIVGATGAYVEIDGKILQQQVLKQEQVKRVTEYLDKRNIEYLVSANGVLYGTPESVASQTKKLLLYGQMSDKVMKGAKEFISIMHETPKPNEVEGVYKILFFQAKGITLQELQKEFEDYFTVISGTIDFMDGISGEIYGNFYNKATGMQKVMEYYGIPKEDTIAFGDGANDFEMIEFAGTGVAMGNAVEALKKCADYVTTSVSEDGLYQAFAHLGII